MAFILLLFLYWIIYVISSWSMYEKMNMQGWISMIPFYNAWCLFESLYGYGAGIRSLTLLVPGLNIYVFILESLDLTYAFGQERKFAIGMIFLRPIFTTILGFGPAEFDR
ncbi:MAG: DUF5684 domain-containing protein [Lachnospiraceae bacterium]|nr:DUF5684 domain-containing protein [Lachnospiraceae bacterium]